MASTIPPIRGSAFTVTFPLFNTSGKLLTGCAFTSTQVSKDNGSFAAATNAPAELATASGVYTLALTGTEMTADVVCVKFVVSTASAQDATVLIYTALRRIDDLTYPATTGRSTDVDASGRVLLQPTQTGVTIPTVTTLTTTPSDSSGVTTLLTRIAAALTIISGKVDVNDKTGFSLAATGLDAVSAPADLANDAAARANFVGMFRAVFNRFYNNTTQTATQQKVYKDDSTTLVSTMPVSDNGTTATKGKSS